MAQGGLLSFVDLTVIQSFPNINQVFCCPIITIPNRGLFDITMPCQMVCYAEPSGELSFETNLIWAQLFTVGASFFRQKNPHMPSE